MMAVTDLIMMVMFTLLIGILFFVGMYLKDTIMPEIRSLGISAPAAEVMNKVEYSFNVFDTSFLFIVMGFGIATLLLATMVDTHPAFFVASLIVFIILMIVVPSIANVMKEFAGDSNFAVTKEHFPIMSIIFENYTMIILAFGMTLMVVLYGKARGMS